MIENKSVQKFAERAYPLKFKPLYKEMVWGGRKLSSFFHKDIPASKKIGESWELADLPGEKSIITNGELAGKTIGWAINKYPQQITGEGKFSGEFPLLIKFIDAAEVLSVQVHPDEQSCRNLGTGAAKTECWYIVSAEKGAVIYKGLKKGVTKEKFVRALQDGTVAELLVKVPVRAGECHFLPGGMIHSIGAGLLIAEIQTPSDATYRVFDWNRVDKSGQPRQLHIKEAIASIDFDGAGAEAEVTTSGLLVNCKYFKVDKEWYGKDSALSISPGQMQVLIIIKGFGIITSDSETVLDFAAGETVLIPASYAGNIRFSAETEYLKVTI